MTAPCPSDQSSNCELANKPPQAQKISEIENPTPGPTRLQTESKNSNLAHVEHTFSTNCTFQRTSRLLKIHFENRVSSRLHQMLAFLSIERLVYPKHILSEADPPSGGNLDVDFCKNNWKCTLQNGLPST